MLKILLADDDEDFRELFCLYLRDYDIDVMEVACGENIEFILEKRKFDFIVVDMVMHGMHGLEVLQKFGSKVDIFVLSGCPENKPEALKLGAKYFFDKPFNLKIFKEVIRKNYTGFTKAN